MIGKYLVVRTHSHTDRQQLLKVVSRPMKCLEDAGEWREFCESEEKNKKHKFFVVQVVETKE